MDVENQHPFVESEENQKQLDMSEENEEVLIEQRGDDALENQDEAAVDKESGGEEGMGNSEDMKIVAATEGINEPEDETGQEEIPQDTRQISDFEEENRGVEPADLELMVHVPKQVGFDEEDTEQNSDMEQEDNGMENVDTAVDREAADLELMVHVPKEDGFVDEKEQDELVVEADDDKVTDLDEDAEVENVPEVPKDTAVGRVPADQELMVHNPDNDREKISEISKEADSEEEPADVERKIDPEITKEPEIEKEPADLELMVHDADTDSNKPKSDKEQAQLELLVQKDENDNDDEVGHEEIHRNGDVITQKKPEIKAKPKSGSVKNSIAKFNETGAKKVFLPISTVFLIVFLIKKILST